MAVEQFSDIAGIGIDTWGVDYGLIDADGKLLEDPVCYRDPRGGRGQGYLDKIASRASRFTQSGIAQLPINTIDQLAADAVERPEL